MSKGVDVSLRILMRQLKLFAEKLSSGVVLCLEVILLILSCQNTTLLATYCMKLTQ